MVVVLIPLARLTGANARLGILGHGRLIGSIPKVAVILLKPNCSAISEIWASLKMHARKRSCISHKAISQVLPKPRIQLY